MNNKKPEVLGVSPVTQSRLFTIEAVDLRFSNGVEVSYERLKGRAVGSVLVVPLLDDNTILLIREYGAGVGEYTLGFPKGAIEAGEDLIDSANRELMEEIGYAAKSITKLRKLCLSPGYMESASEVLLAQDLYACREEGDEPEPLEVVPWSLDNIDELLAHPEFWEARSIAALLMVVRRLSKEGAA